MKEMWSVMRGLLAVVGGWLGWFLGGCDGLVFALVFCVVVDYVTGVMCAIADRRLSSAVGFRGICKKVLIFLLVGQGHVLDVHVVGAGSVLRTAVIFFYISNEGVSLLENAVHLGLPVPVKLRKVLEMLHDRAEKEDAAGEGVEDSENRLARLEGAEMKDAGAGLKGKGAEQRDVGPEEGLTEEALRKLDAEWAKLAAGEDPALEDCQVMFQVRRKDVCAEECEKAFAAETPEGKKVAEIDGTECETAAQEGTLPEIPGGDPVMDVFLMDV